MQPVAALGLIDGDGMGAVFGTCADCEETEQRQNKTGRAMSRPTGALFGPED
jgi:hypothetical protein